MYVYTYIHIYIVKLIVNGQFEEDGGDTNECQPCSKDTPMTTGSR